MIERNFDVTFVAGLALREKQIQQNYRPVIAVHKWFARRPGTLFRSLILSEFTAKPISESFYQANHLPSVRIFDPFMGGGTTMMEANRIGCSITGTDINPMAWWIVRQEIFDLDVNAYLAEANRLRRHLESEIGHLYRTRCLKCGSGQALVKYFLWVKTVGCNSCKQRIDMFPNFMVSEDVRHPANVFVCGSCGELYETVSQKDPGPCPRCGKLPAMELTAKRNKVRCGKCDATVAYPDGAVPEHRLFAMEYYCGECAGKTKGRFFKKPDMQDRIHFEEAQIRLQRSRLKFVPNESILEGDETARLHRWGYHRYRDLFNVRQLLGLELSCRFIAQIKNERIREALATNLSDLLRYQNMLCRYDTMALKSLDVFSVHGFPVGLIQCESNVLGISGNAGQPVGSGGWLNIVEKFAKAKRYCIQPFEIRHEGGKKEFRKESTRHQNELTGNINMGRGLDHFTEGLSQTLRKATNALKPGRPLVFTYHHNQLDAYVPLAVAILDAGLVCSASLPCPAEMGASIHINGTGSSIVDTVFVCRSTGSFPRRWLASDPDGIATLVQSDVGRLADGGLKATQGDIRCIAYGHLTRMAIWNLRDGWKSNDNVDGRMGAISRWFADFGGLGAVLHALAGSFRQASREQQWPIRELVRETEPEYDEISF